MAGFWLNNATICSHSLQYYLTPVKAEAKSSIFTKNDEQCTEQELHVAAGWLVGLSSQQEKQQCTSEFIWAFKYPDSLHKSQISRIANTDNDQCDQIHTGIKCNPNFPKAAQKVPKSVFDLKVIYLKVAQKVDKYLGYLKDTICLQELSKIAQSGHTDNNRVVRQDDVNCLKK